MLDRLPHHIFLEILYRIPVKFLVKCTSVSKTWYHLIKSASFISAHLESSKTRNAKDPHLVRLLINEDRDVSLHFESVESSEYFHKQLNIPDFLSPLHKNLWLIGYSNGIFCYALSQYKNNRRVYYEYFLWNPSIQKYFTIPPPCYKYHIIAAFVFDSNVNDFKVFATRESSEVEVYSVKNDSWKCISSKADSVCDGVFFCSEDYVFVKGIIYFVVIDYDMINNYVLGFDLAEEVFHKNMLPVSLSWSDIQYPIQYGDDNSIAVVGDYVDHIELWVREGCNVSGSWVKVLDMVHDDRYVMHIFGVLNGKDMLLKNVSGRVISLDLQSHQRKDIGLVQGERNGYNCIHQYEETLALLNEGADISILEGEIVDRLDYESDSDDHA